MADCFIYDHVRTPRGRGKPDGALHEVAPVDLASGVTNHAVRKNRFVEKHPDTGVPVVGMEVPYWNQVLELSRRVAQAVGLGYVGVDIVIDAARGPLLLEANARPGLAIQISNAQGLLLRLEQVDPQLIAASGERGASAP